MCSLFIDAKYGLVSRSGVQKCQSKMQIFINHISLKKWIILKMHYTSNNWNICSMYSHVYIKFQSTSPWHLSKLVNFWILPFTKAKPTKLNSCLHVTQLGCSQNPFLHLSQFVPSTFGLHWQPSSFTVWVPLESQPMPL